MSRDGHIELDWAVDAIRVGARARQDLGDLTPLIDSIRTSGLLQPITISPDGVLLCGLRRLAAVKQLGQRIVNVWVRTGVSTRLERLVAEQDENTQRQALLPTEAAALYRELRQILAEDAARRQEATRYGAENGPTSGGAKLAPPAAGKTRTQAARMVTGGNSYTTLERVGRVQQIAHDPTVPDDVRQLAATALTQMDADGKVDGHYRQVLAAYEGAHDRQLTGLAKDAIARATTKPEARPTDQGGSPRPDTTGSPPRAPRQLGVRAFLLTWNELSGWADRYDPIAIGPELTEPQWAAFARTVENTVEFLDQARQARAAAL